MLFILKHCAPRHSKTYRRIVISTSIVLCFISLKLHYKDNAPQKSHEREMELMIQESDKKVILKSHPIGQPSPTIIRRINYQRQDKSSVQIAPIDVPSHENNIQSDVPVERHQRNVKSEHGKSQTKKIVDPKENRHVAADGKADLGNKMTENAAPHYNNNSTKNVTYERAARVQENTKHLVRNSREGITNINKKRMSMKKHIPNTSEPLKDISTNVSFQNHNRNVVVNAQGMPVVVNAIYWSPEVEKLVPPGYTEEQYQEFVSQTSHESAVAMQTGGRYSCGRGQNQYVHLAEGTGLCVRYRYNIFIYGELLSFHLSRMLGLDNVPPMVLNRVNFSAPLWSNMRGEIERARWKEGTLVALIKWIDDLSSTNTSLVHMPPLLLDAIEKNRTLKWNSPSLKIATNMDLQTLMQWSDLIVFDYITANYDRVATMQKGAMRDKNPKVMHEEMWNLPASPNTGKLWLIDNEGGLQNAYLVHGQQPEFIGYHKQMLESMCVFHKRTIENLRNLAASVDPSDVLLKYASDHEPLFDETHMQAASQYLRISFQSRLHEVLNWVDKCPKLRRSYVGRVQK